jgi:hypothetical protein
MVSKASLTGCPVRIERAGMASLGTPSLPRCRRKPDVSGSRASAAFPLGIGFLG